MVFPIYHLDATWEHGLVTVTVNGFPALRGRALGSQPEWFAPPINLFLVGSGNTLVVEVSPIPTPGSAVPAWPAVAVSGGVRRFRKGSAVSPGAGEPVLEFDIREELQNRLAAAAQAGAVLPAPQTFAWSFDNEGPAFREELLEAEVIGDREALLEYGMHLRRLVEKRDLRGLLDEFHYKIAAYAAAYDEPPGRFAESLAEVLRDGILAGRPVTEFERSDLLLQPWCGGRIWEIRRNPGLPLIQTEPDATGGTMEVEVFVGLRRRSCRLVR